MENPDTQKLDEFAEAAKNDEEAISFMNPLDRPKKKRGRPPGSKNKLPNPEPHLADEPLNGPGLSLEKRLEANKLFLRPCFTMLSDTAIRITGEKEAGIQDSEMNVLLETGAACIEQYLPDLLGQHMNLIVLTLTLGQWGMRVYRVYELKAELLRREAYQQAQAGIPSTHSQAVN